MLPRPPVGPLKRPIRPQAKRLLLINKVIQNDMNTLGCEESIFTLHTIHVILKTITRTRMLKGGGFGLTPTYPMTCCLRVRCQVAIIQYDTT